ncbi:MAG: 3-keto-5-aminohexanoate cleavage protein [Pseudomonadota bacterium]
MNPTILSCAVTGSITTLDQHPGLPCTPEQIANACIGAARAGAAITHIHVRHPDGKSSMELHHYREVVERVRASDVDVVINLTAGMGGRFVPGTEDPKVAGPGTNFLPPEQRVAHVMELRPEICSLDFNTMNSATAATINTPRNVRIMAGLIREAGTLPELELFDGGDLMLARELLDEGTLQGPGFFQLVLGVKYGAAATPATLAYLKSMLPADCQWSAFGVSRWSFPMLAQSFLLGGHVRVGLEDNIYLEKGVLAPDNAALVAKGKRMIQDLGGRLATPGEAREILGLKKRAPQAAR